MKILDSENKLLAIIIRYDDILDGKNFETDNEASFQLASFNLEENTEIEKHYHPQQERIISSTSEVLVMLEGEMIVNIYDDDQNFIQSEKIFKGDTLALLAGGHGIKFAKKSKFIEVKQGPYNPDTDKIRF